MQTQIEKQNYFEVEINADELSLEESALAFSQSARTVRMFQWVQAEICASVETRFGKGDVTAFVEAVRASGERFFSRTKFYSYSQTWRKLKDSRIRENLPFSYFQLAAAKSETAEDAEEFVETANQNSWTYRELEAHIEHREQVSEYEGIADKPVSVKPQTMKLYLTPEDQADIAEVENYYATESRQEAVLKVIREKARFIRDQWTKRIAA